MTPAQATARLIRLTAEAEVREAGATRPTGVKGVSWDAALAAANAERARR